jgi:hypothetical protein
MVLSPNDIQKKGVSSETYLEIDSQLQSHSQDWYEDYTFAVLIGEMSQTQKSEIIRKYKGAGWSAVVVRNSSENDERPGLCCVECYY